MPTYAPPSPPFIGARYKGGSQTPKAIVLHGTVSSDNPGTARNIARWWAGSTSPKTSCHYVVDPREVIQCVGDHTIAFHCGSNSNTIGVEFCDEQTGSARRWDDADSQMILKRGARLVAELSLAYGIAVKRPSITALKLRGKHGIYSHDDSRRAFGNTSHTDPRDFPWDRFMGMVRNEVLRIKGGAIVKPRTFTSDATVVIANVKSNPLMTPAYAKADYEKTFAAARTAGAQSVYLNEYHRSYATALNAVATKYGYAVVRDNASGLVVATRKNNWANSGSKYTLLAGGISGVSPNRGVLRRGQTTPGKTRVVFDCTMLPRGWNFSGYAKHAQTKAMATKMFAGLKPIIQGQTVDLKSAAILGGDMNQGSLVDIERFLGIRPAAAWAPGESASAVDRMMQAFLFLPPGWSGRVENAYQVKGDFHTDHRPIVVHFRITRPV